MGRAGEPGIVYLVGAGPGNPELITMRGLRLIREAEVVVYDRLVHRDLLDESSPFAEMIDVGKSVGHHSINQADINRILVDRARRCNIVVRLKGGDPFVFGRGGEECLALQRDHIPFEIVPGVTSAVSVPAHAGIPLTHRGVASAFTVVTGHSCDPDNGDLDWASLSRIGTLVILMGVRKLPEISLRLITHGRSPETPVAVVSKGSTEEQIVVEGTLEDIAERAREITSPATIVVGPVVHLRRELQWFEPETVESALMLNNAGNLINNQ